MKKKYTTYKVSLFIGLLSLNTLSSCVHTKQGLGVREYETVNTEEGKIKQVGMWGKLKRSYNYNPIKTVTCLAIPVAGLLGGASAIGIWGINRFGNQTNIPNIGNGSSSITTPLPTNLSTTTTPSIANMNATMSDTEVQFIVNATQKTPTDWVTEGGASDGVKVEDPKVLDDGIMQDLEMYDFSPKRIDYWLTTKGLNIDAQGPVWDTLLMQVIQGGKIENRWNTSAIQFMIDKGVDVNVKNHYGTTALMYAAMRGSEEAVQLLINNKANVNAKDNNGQTALTFANDASIQKLLSNEI